MSGDIRQGKIEMSGEKCQERNVRSKNDRKEMKQSRKTGEKRQEGLMRAVGNREEGDIEEENIRN